MLSIDRNKSIIFAACIFLLFVFTKAHAESFKVKMPIIGNNKVIFSNMKTLVYRPVEVINNNYEEARKKGEPVSISTKVLLIDKWKRLALIKTKEFYEGSIKEITIYTYEGDNINIPVMFEGEEVFLKNTDRILLVQHSAHHKIDRSILLDLNGKIIKELNQNANVFDFGCSDDDKVFWFISNSVKHGLPLNTVSIYNSYGILIHEVESTHAEVLRFQYEEKDYFITIKAPEIPG